MYLLLKLRKVNCHSFACRDPFSVPHSQGDVLLFFSQRGYRRHISFRIHLSPVIEHVFCDSPIFCDILHTLGHCILSFHSVIMNSSIALMSVHRHGFLLTFLSFPKFYYFNWDIFVAVQRHMHRFSFRKDFYTYTIPVQLLCVYDDYSHYMMYHSRTQNM